MRGSLPGKYRCIAARVIAPYSSSASFTNRGVWAPSMTPPPDNDEVQDIRRMHTVPHGSLVVRSTTTPVYVAGDCIAEISTCNIATPVACSIEKRTFVSGGMAGSGACKACTCGNEVRETR